MDWFDKGDDGHEDVKDDADDDDGDVARRDYHWATFPPWQEGDKMAKQYILSISTNCIQVKKNKLNQIY